MTTIALCTSCRRANQIYAYEKTKAQIRFAVTAKLISAFVFATFIVQFLFFLNWKFQASSHLLCLYSSVCVRPGRKPQRPVFSHHGSYKSETESYQTKSPTKIIKLTVTYKSWFKDIILVPICRHLCRRSYVFRRRLR